MKKDDTHKQVIFSDKKIKVYEKIIKDETAEKKRELNRALDNKVDEVFDKKYQLFDPPIIFCHSVLIATHSI